MIGFLFDIFVGSFFLVLPVAVLGLRNASFMPPLLRCPERWGLRAVLFSLFLLFLIFIGYGFVICGMIAAQFNERI
jgi:hypothetical protein